MTKDSELGGGKTTKNGNKFEDSASVRKTLSDSGEYEVFDDELYNKDRMLLGMFYKKVKLKDLIKLLNLNQYIGEGKEWTVILSPDDALYIPSTKDLYIFEMKYQEKDGSVAEKLQTGGYKKYYYRRLFESKGGLTVHYCYILCDYFKNPVFEPVFEYLREVGVDYYFNHIDKSYIDLSKATGPIEYNPKLW